MSSTAVVSKKQPLDEVMLAMDVVDTLRHRQRMVDKELDSNSRALELRKRLKKIYAAQGIDVPEHVIEDAVKALEEDRFSYKPAAVDSFGRKLAEIYVQRAVWGKWLFGLLAALIIAATLYQFAIVMPRAALPAQIEAANQTSVQLAKSPAAKQLAAQEYAAAKTALRNKDYKAVKTQLNAIEDLQAKIEQEYTLRIVSERGIRSGVWRIPDVNKRAKNFYLIVEAINNKGQALRLPISSEETGKTKLVSKWGLRVDQRIFESIQRDKRDDGVIQNDRIATKRRGYLKPDYSIPTTGATITRW